MGSCLPVQRLLQIVEIQNEVVATQLNFEAVMELVAERAAQMTGADAGIVEIPSGNEMVYRAVTGYAVEHRGLRLDIDHSLSGMCLRAGVVLRCDDTLRDPRVDAAACRTVGARSMICVPLRHRGAAMGVLKVYAGEPNAFDGADVELLEHLSGVIAAHMYNAAEFERLDGESRRNERQALAGLRALARAIDAKDSSTREHSDRVARLAAATARRLGWSAQRVQLLSEAALVHDVGKIGVPDAVLLKPGRLDPDEYGRVQQHAALGADIVDGVLRDEQVGWVRWHHERPDGRGYPDGLTDGAIPDGAAIIALADAWDVMTASRPYSPPIGREAALRECFDCAGTQFRPDVLAVFSELV